MRIWTVDLYTTFLSNRVDSIYSFIQVADDNDLLPVLLFMFISFFSALKCVYKIGMFMYIYIIIQRKL